MTTTDTVPAVDPRTLLAVDPRTLLAVDPRLLTSAERRSRLLDLQRLAAEIDAAHLATLVAECGPTPRERSVLVDAPWATDAERESTQFGAGPGVSGPRLANGKRELTFTDEVVDELAPLLHRTHGSVAADLRVARLLHGPLAGVRESLSAGRITAAHARALCRQAARMQHDDSSADLSIGDVADDFASAADPSDDDTAFARLCAEFERRILPIAESSTPGRTESQAERLVAVLDAAAQRRRREQARARMGVWAQSEGDGLMSITAVLSSIDAAAVMGAVDAQTESARRLACADTASRIPLSPPAEPGLTIGQQRAEALLTLLGIRHAAGNMAGTADDTTRSAEGPAGFGNATVGALPSQPMPGVEIQVVVDARTLLALEPDAADAPAWVQVGSHAPGAVDRDTLLALLADPAVPTTLRRLISDPITGALIDRGAQRYTPNADLIAWLSARDGGCRFPGCTARAYRCDVDHATEFDDGGATILANTGLLCRRHHNRKTHGGWRIEESAADGSCTFIAPDGTRHRHRPAPLANPPTLDP